MTEATIHESRTGVLKNMRDLIDKAEKEGRSLNADETSNYEKMESEFSRFTKTIDIQNKQASMEAALAKPLTAPILHTPGGDALIDVSKPKFDAVMEAYSHALIAGLRHNSMAGAPAFTDKDRLVLKAALEQGTDTAGGYLVPPQEFVAALIQKIDDMVWIRSRATKFTLRMAKTLGFPSLDNDPSDADWTPEVGQSQEDTAMSFGKREFEPHKLSKRIKPSMKLLANSAVPIVQLIINRLAYKFGITEEKHYLTGNGASQPLGLFTASDAGISTGRDVSEEMTTTAITADGLINVKYSLKGQYWKKAEWLFHRDAMKQIAKLKSTTNEYLFRDSLRAGEPDMLLGRPIMMSEYAPNTFADGLYVGMLGDFSHYWIVDALDMSIQRLDELYAENDQVGFIGRKETDGMPVVEEAFARVKLA